MATIDKPLYGGVTNITQTLAGLASSYNAGRSCAVIDNTVNLYLDAMLYVSVKVNTTGSIQADRSIYLYFFGSLDGTNFSGSSLEAVGSDAPCTILYPTNLKGPISISGKDQSGANPSFSILIGSVAEIFGGRLPPYWGYVLVNYTNYPLSSTESDHKKQYIGISVQAV